MALGWGDVRRVLGLVGRSWVGVTLVETLVGSLRLLVAGRVANVGLLLIGSLLGLLITPVGLLLGLVGRDRRLLVLYILVLVAHVRGGLYGLDGRRG